MDKKCTLIAAALMVAGVFSANAQSSTTVPEAQWKAGNYYYLKTGSSVLSLSGEKADSIIVKTLASDATKAAIDSALWQITNAGTTPAGPVYQFKNKKTQAVLSFAASSTAKPVITSGVNQWTFSDAAGGSAIQAYYGNNQILALDVAGTDLSLGSSASSTKFTVEAPSDAMYLSASELGDGFQVFQLTFGGNYQGNIFEGKNLIAKNTAAPATGAIANAKYVTLQIQGDQVFSDGKAKYLGVDTLKNVIAGATGVYGAKFTADSTYDASGLHTLGNADFQKFYFTINLKNDALAMYAAAAPTVNASPMTSVPNVRVVYASVIETKALTVSDLQSGSTQPAQGAAPVITVTKGTPSTIATGTGVYFLKSASKGDKGGQYAVAYDKSAASDKLVTAAGFKPSIYQPKGQWYIKENNGMYSVVDRNTNTTIISNEEIFAVQGMANTYTFGGSTDSITVEYQANVDLKDKFLGTRHFSAEELADNGYVLNLISGTPGVDDLYAFTSDSVLMIKSGDAANAAALRIVVSQDSVQNVTDGLGARALGDTLYHATYMLKERFSNDLVASENGGPLKLSDYTAPLEFVFNTATTGGKYQMATRVGATTQYVFMNVNTANLILSDKVNYFDFVAVEAPEYASIDNSHKRFGTNGKFLTMNPLNFFAEVKNEGQDILKSTYETDNFSLWVQEADTVIAGKPLYFITTSIYTPETTTKAVSPRYYMVSLRDSNETFVSNGATYYRVGFSDKANIVPSLDNNALFAFKTTQDGGYLLENQKELNRTVAAGELKTPYVGVVNNVVVMSNVGVPFTIENAPTPVSNEQLEEVASFTVIAGEASVTVLNAAGKTVTLSNILGQTTASAIASSDNFVMPASKGIVVVSVDGETAQKVVVK